MARKHTELLIDLQDRIKGLEREAELFRTVLIVKEPNSVIASQSYDGLRKQIVAAAAERRSHLAQLVAMQVAVSRATSLDDLIPQVKEWLEQAGVVEVTSVPPGASPSDVFEDVIGDGLNGRLAVLEPAYLDAQTGALLRLGRAQRAVETGVPAKSPKTTEPITKNPEEEVTA